MNLTEDQIKSLIGDQAWQDFKRISVDWSNPTPDFVNQFSDWVRHKIEEDKDWKVFASINTNSRNDNRLMTKQKLIELFENIQDEVSFKINIPVDELGKALTSRGNDGEGSIEFDLSIEYYPSPYDETISLWGFFDPDLVKKQKDLKNNKVMREVEEAWEEESDKRILAQGEQK